MADCDPDVSNSGTCPGNPCFLFLAVPHGMRDILVPRPRAQTHAPVVEAWSPNHWTAREVPAQGIHGFECAWELL